MFHTTLFAAIDSASQVICNGFEIDEFEPAGEGKLSLGCGEQEVAVVADQAIEVDGDGVATIRVDEHEDGGHEVRATFKVSIPLREQDLMVV